MLLESDSSWKRTVFVVQRHFLGDLDAMASTRAVSLSMLLQSCHVSLFACIGISSRRSYIASTCSLSCYMSVDAAVLLSALCELSNLVNSTAAFTAKKLFLFPLAASYASKLLTFLLKKLTALMCILSPSGLMVHLVIVCWLKRAQSYSCNMYCHTLLMLLMTSPSDWSLACSSSRQHVNNVMCSSWPFHLQYKFLVSSSLILLFITTQMVLRCVRHCLS